jgi:hypothetical protein
MKLRINDVGMRHHETSISRTTILHRVSSSKTVSSDLISKQTPTAGHNPVAVLEMSTFKQRLEGRMDENCVANQVPLLSVCLLDVL